MTLVTLPSPVRWPGILSSLSSTPQVNTLATLTSVGHYAAVILCAKEAMTISHVAFRAGVAAGSPTMEVRIETLDATGFPSGTLWGTNTNGTTGTVSSNSNVLQALTASASIAAGQIFCVKFALASGTSQEVMNLQNQDASTLPYWVRNTGTPTKFAPNGGTFSLALGSSSTTFYNIPGAMPVSAYSAGAFNNTSSAKRGLRFTPPMNCRVVGVRWFNTNSIGDFNAVLYNDAGTELSSSSTAFDGDHNASSTSPNQPYTVYFDNPVTLTAGTTYRAAIEPSSATNVNVSTITLYSATYRGGTPAGTTAHYTTFATATWTDTATDTLPLLDILIDQVDDGAGSGGGGSGAFFGA